MSDRGPGRRGAVMVALAIALPAFLALLVVGIDLGRLGHAATEVQTVADSAATAGATALLLGRGAGAATADARQVADRNRVDGQGGRPAVTGVTLGRWDDPMAAFVPGGGDPSAVRVTAGATIATLVAGVLGDPTATVDKTATAAFAGLGQARPTLPLAVGECRFPVPQACFGRPGCLPTLSAAPQAGENTAWTAFRQAATAGNVRRYLPAACGGSATPPSLRVGDVISRSTTSFVPVLQALRGCVVAGTSEFLVPVLACGGTGNARVTGFATLVVDGVSATPPQGVNAHAVFRQVAGAPRGCPRCGTGFATLVD